MDDSLDGTTSLRDAVTVEGPTAAAPPTAAADRRAGRAGGPGASAMPADVISDFELGFRGPLYGYRGAALFGVVCAMPFISGLTKGPPLDSILPGAVAYGMGFVWILGLMRLIHWLGSKPSWSPRLKRNVLVAAFLALPVTGWVLAQIVTRI